MQHVIDVNMFLILDNLRVHHSKLVKAWLADKTEKIKVFYLPSYSPQLHPDERLNADLKYAIDSKCRCEPRSNSKQRQHNTCRCCKPTQSA